MIRFFIVLISTFLISLCYIVIYKAQAVKLISRATSQTQHITVRIAYMADEASKGPTVEVLRTELSAAAVAMASATVAADVDDVVEGIDDRELVQSGVSLRDIS